MEGAGVSRRPDYPKPDYYVTVYCKAESHADQPWIIGTWTLAESLDGSFLYWRYSPDQWLNGEFVRTASGRHDSNRVVGGQELLDIGTVEGRRRQQQLGGEGVRVFETNRLACHRCGDRMKRSTAALQDDLKRLAGAGIRDIGLAEYRAFINMR